MILDTNAISDLAENNFKLAEIVDRAAQAALPFIAVAEYQFGLLGSTRPKKGQAILDGLVKTLPLLLPDSQTIRHYAEIAVELKKRGRPIPTNDLWIAALARQHSLPILSQDRHFDHIPDLQRIGW
jgi:predicted nucleic acid-binding protein